MDCDAKALAVVVRSHWGVEISLHRVLDMAFREDESRMRKGHSAENFAIVRRIIFTLFVVILPASSVAKRGARLPAMNFLIIVLKTIR